MTERTLCRIFHCPNPPKEDAHVVRSDNPGGAHRRQSLARAGRAGPARHAAVHDADRLVPGHPAAGRGPEAEQHPDVVDHRYLRLPDGRSPGHHGHPGRPHRSPSAADRGRGRLRRRVGDRGQHLRPRHDDHLEGAAGHRRGHPDARHPGTHLLHVRRPPATWHRRRHLVGRDLRRHRSRPGDRRGAAGGVLLARGLPHRGAHHGDRRDRRAAAAAQPP